MNSPMLKSLLEKRSRIPGLVAACIAALAPMNLPVLPMPVSDVTPLITPTSSPSSTPTAIARAEGFFSADQGWQSASIVVRQG